MRSGWAIVGVGVFLLVTLRQVATYGREWQFGRYGMPTIIVAADGCHYQTGEEIDAITLALVRSGYEEVVELLLAGVMVGGIGYFIHSSFNRQRARMRHGQLQALLDTAEECQRTGRWEEAEAAFRRFEELWAEDKQAPPLRRTSM